MANLDKFGVELDSLCSVGNGITVGLGFDVCLEYQVRKGSGVKIVWYIDALGLGW